MEAPPLVREQWSNAQKLLFRFVAAYIIVYISSFLCNFADEALELSIGKRFDPMMIWIGQHILHIAKVSTQQNGSGDTSYYYAQEVLFIIVAVVAGLVWSVMDNRRTNYSRLLYWVKVLVRYYLAFFLMAYGIAKFNHGQFSAPNLGRLMQPYGKSSPMGLAWTFLGFSTAYGVFMGISECMGGILMLFRRTTLFGACIATTVVMNIVMINFCYDVPVKLFSSHLLMLSLLVLATEGSRFMNLFIYNRPVPPIDLTPIFHTRKLIIARKAGKVLFMLGVIALPIVLLVKEEVQNDDNIKPPLYGIYNVKTFIRNNDTIPPLNTDTTRWNKLIIAYTGSATTQSMIEKNKIYTFKPDTVHKTVVMYGQPDTATKYHLNYTRADSTLCLSGKFQGDSIYVVMQRYDEKRYLLINRGFHWINEVPFNR